MRRLFIVDFFFAPPHHRSSHDGLVITQSRGSVSTQLNTYTHTHVFRAAADSNRRPFHDKAILGFITKWNVCYRVHRICDNYDSLSYWRTGMNRTSAASRLVENDVHCKGDSLCINLSSILTSICRTLAPLMVNRGNISIAWLVLPRTTSSNNRL